MIERLRVLALGVLGACGGGDDGGTTPRAGNPCTDGSVARCGIAEGSDEARDAVLACEGGVWTQLLWCGEGESCRDDPDRGAVACSVMTLDEVIYGERDGPCKVADAQSCDVDRDYTMVCDAGRWAIDEDCATDVLDCSLVTPDDEPTCTEADGCVACR